VSRVSQAVSGAVQIVLMVFKRHDRAEYGKSPAFADPGLHAADQG
jgi:hypothetical protein